MDDSQCHWPYWIIGKMRKKKARQSGAKKETQPFKKSIDIMQLYLVIFSLFNCDSVSIKDIFRVAKESNPQLKNYMNWTHKCQQIPTHKKYKPNCQKQSITCAESDRIHFFSTVTSCFRVINTPTHTVNLLYMPLPSNNGISTRLTIQSGSTFHSFDIWVIWPKWLISVLIKGKTVTNVN